MPWSRRSVLKAGGQSLALALVPAALARASAAAQTAKHPMPGGIDWARRVKDLPPAGPSDLVLVATGDALVHNRFSDYEEPAAQALFDVVRAADISFVNLEISFTRRGWPRQKDVIRADPSIIEELKWLGVDVVSLGNNHSMDYGPEGLASTLTTLDSSRIKHAGAGPTAKDALAPAVVITRECNVAFLSFLCAFGVTDQRAGDAAPGVAAIAGYTVRTGLTNKEARTQSVPDAAHVKAMEETIRAARRGNDLVVVSYHMHWGERDQVDEGRRVITHAAVDAGADLVICHGPHVLHGIERYQDRYIFHSLGNFFFQMPIAYWELFPALQEVVSNFYGRTAHWETVVPRIVFTDRRISRVDLLPATIVRQGDRLGCPQFADDGRGREIVEEMDRLSKPYGVSIRQNGWYGSLGAIQTL